MEYHIPKEGIIKKQIVVTGLSPHNGTNFFITGEGVKLYNFDDHCANFFKTSIKKTVKKHTKEKELESEENFLSCLDMALFTILLFHPTIL